MLLKTRSEQGVGLWAVRNMGVQVLHSPGSILLPPYRHPCLPRTQLPHVKKCHAVLVWNTGSCLLDCDILQWLALLSGELTADPMYFTMTIALIWCRIGLGLHLGRSLLSDRCVVFSRHTTYVVECRTTVDREIRFETKRLGTYLTTLTSSLI